MNPLILGVSSILGCITTGSPPLFYLGRTPVCSGLTTPTEFPGPRSLISGLLHLSPPRSFVARSIAVLKGNSFTHSGCPLSCYLESSEQDRRQSQNQVHHENLVKQQVRVGGQGTRAGEGRPSQNSVLAIRLNWSGRARGVSQPLMQMKKRRRTSDVRGRSG